jgi:hypothetical protein
VDLQQMIFGCPEPVDAHQEMFFFARKLPVCRRLMRHLRLYCLNII